MGELVVIVWPLTFVNVKRVLPASAVRQTLMNVFLSHVNTEVHVRISMALTFATASRATPDKTVR